MVTMAPVLLLHESLGSVRPASPVQHSRARTDRGSNIPDPSLTLGGGRTAAPADRIWGATIQRLPGSDLARLLPGRDMRNMAENSDLNEVPTGAKTWLGD